MQNSPLWMLIYWCHVDLGLVHSIVRLPILWPFHYIFFNWTKPEDRRWWTSPQRSQVFPFMVKPMILNICLLDKIFKACSTNSHIRSLMQMKATRYFVWCFALGILQVNMNWNTFEVVKLLVNIKIHVSFKGAEWHCSWM